MAIFLVMCFVAVSSIYCLWFTVFSKGFSAPLVLLIVLVLYKEDKRVGVKLIYNFLMIILFQDLTIQFCFVVFPPALDCPVGYVKKGKACQGIWCIKE